MMDELDVDELDVDELDVDEEEVASEISPKAQQQFLKTVDQMVDTIDDAQVHIENDLPQDLENAVGYIQDQCASSEETAVFLARDDTLWNFWRILKWGKISRLNELVLGILANMAHYESVRLFITNNADLRDIVFYMLHVRDVPTLIELARLIHTCISGDCLSEEKWRETVKEHITSFIDHTQYILQNCKNEQLLSQLTYLIDQLIDVESGENVVLTHISNWDYIAAIVPATEILLEEFEHFSKICRPLHILHTLLVDPSTVRDIPSKISLAIMKLLSCFSTRCSTSRVLSKDMERTGEDGQLWCAGQVSTACVLQISTMLFQVSTLDSEEQRERQDRYKTNIRGFAERIVDAYGVLSAIEVFFPDGSPWSDICYRVDGEDRKGPPDPISADLYKYAKEVMGSTHADDGGNEQRSPEVDAGRGRN